MKYSRQAPQHTDKSITRNDSPTQDLIIMDNGSEVHIVESKLKERPDEVWTSTIKCLLDINGLMKHKSIIPTQVISQSNTTDSRNSISQQVLKNSLEEEFLKAIDDIFGYEIEGEKEHSSTTNTVDSNIASFLFHEPIGGSYIGSSSWVGLRSSEVDELDRDVEIGWCTLCGDVGSAVWIQANRWYVKDLELDFIASVKFGSKRDKLRKSICNNGLHAFLTKEQ
ncbi:hypothetical protein FXO38_33976 [Capsicum annuum]|nr:hypothetical protein FXO38_33976 [Capsicum annuum]